MDTAEYETNALVISGISSLSYAFYEPTSPPSTLFGPGAFELEAALREDGYLANVDANRRGLWCFQVQRGEQASGSQADGLRFPRTLERCGHVLSLVDEGALEPGSLAPKPRPFGPNAVNTPNSSSSSGSTAMDPNLRTFQSATPTPVQQFSGFAFESDAISVAAQDGSATLKEVYGHFISAVLSALSSKCCSQMGAIPLNSRALLLPRDKQIDYTSSASTLLSLRVYLTTMGALVVTVSLSLVEGLSSLADSASLPPVGLTILAAPLGVFATCQAVADTENSSAEGAGAQSPDTQVLRFGQENDGTLHSWRKLCAALLRTRNISSSLNGPQKWLSLQRVRRQPVESRFDGKRTPNASQSISWPSSLCFSKTFSRLSSGSATEDTLPLSPKMSYDPLSLAKAWFVNTGERDEQLAQKSREREAVVAAREAASSDGQSHNVTGLSPLALQRPTNTGAPMGTMYPTPPDGVQNPVGFTPSMDGTQSSPGNNVAPTGTADMDAAMHMSGDAYNDGWDNAAVKHERGAAPFETENLFGDLGPDMFGDNDVTDADFNFFDEQQDSMDLSLDLPDLSGMEGNLDVQTNIAAGPLVGGRVQSTEMSTQLGPPSPVFAKPELKHARSSFVGDDPRRSTDAETNRQRSSGFKRPASPFTPDTVFKRIEASFDNRRSFQNSRSNVTVSAFDKVNFGQSLSAVNSKYQSDGRFGLSVSRPEATKASKGLPTGSYPRRRTKARKNTDESPTNLGELFARVSRGVGSTSQRPSPTRDNDSISDADEISLASDQDESSDESDEPLSPVKSTGTRRRRVDEDGESMAASLKEMETFGTSSPHLSWDLPQLSKSDIELPLAKYFADPEPPSIHFAVSDHDFMVAVQILTDQVATSTLLTTASSSAPSLHSKFDRRRQLLSAARRLVQDLRLNLPECLGGGLECRFRPLIDVQDVPFVSQPTRMQPRPPGAETLKPSNLFQIPSPHFEVRRYDSRLSVLPSAIPFWESLGLGPSNGNKDINAICIFPELPGLLDDADGFLDRMKSVYESLKLGSFSRLATPDDAQNGLFSLPVERLSESLQGTTSFPGPSLHKVISKVTDGLLQLTSKETNVVCFFVYCSDMPGGMVDSCCAFHLLFERYKALLAINGKSVDNELALQLIPADFIGSPDALVAPSPADFLKLALETYDRCTAFGGPVPSPAIILEQPLPRLIDFKLSANPSSSLLHENSCLHVAYAQSVDERWITVAWTDNRGSQQMTSSYCLGRKGKPRATPFVDVANDIWSTMCELVSIWKVHWRIIITKCGVMEPSEIEHWSTLAQSESRACITLTLLTVDTDPSLQLIPPPVRLPSTTGAVSNTTPVSTPQASSILSPEQSGNPPTPSLHSMASTPAPTPGPAGDAQQQQQQQQQPESDAAEAQLVDVTDHTWGAILSHRLSNAHAPGELRPALASGYLVKRGGARPEDPPAVMEVNLVHNEGNPRAFEALLREMLTYFRGLGTLARARGIVEREVDVRPWHVAAAEKGVRALYMMM